MVARPDSSVVGHMCNFICGVLDGNVCGDYGINLLVDNSSTTIDVCHPSKMFSGPLGSGVVVDLWYTADAKFEVACHFWCTEDGSLPSKRPNDEDSSSSGVITDLVSVFMCHEL
jgi:hypothetical protein